MRIAIPLANEKLCLHFGHCEAFGLYDIADGKIIKTEKFNPPPHEPGLYPKLLKELGVNTIISGGMGGNAQMLFKAAGVQVVTGAAELNPIKLIEDYLNNRLIIGRNACDH